MIPVLGMEREFPVSEVADRLGASLVHYGIGKTMLSLLVVLTR